jgi:outer membrane immunogenic protein
MKKLLLTSAALAALLGGSAMAADLPVTYKAAPPVVVYNWTGCYIGVHAGYGSFHDDNYSAATGGSGIAGGQLGCNYQFDQFVVGIEGEGFWSGMKSAYDFTEVGASQHWTVRNKADYDVALRFGIAVNRALIYGKAGIAWAKLDYTYSDSTGITEIGSNTLSGVLVGAGLEYALGNNWSAKFEYDYIALNAKGVLYACTPNCANTINGTGTSYTETESGQKHIVKLGINYRFGTGAVVANY